MCIGIPLKMNRFSPGFSPKKVCFVLHLPGSARFFTSLSVFSCEDHHRFMRKFTCGLRLLVSTFWLRSQVMCCIDHL